MSGGWGGAGRGLQRRLPSSGHQVIDAAGKLHRHLKRRAYAAAGRLAVRRTWLTMPPKLSFRLISLFSPFSSVDGNCGAAASRERARREFSPVLL